MANNTKQNNVAQKQVRLITAPKTERKYERVADAYELCRVIENLPFAKELILIKGDEE